MTKLEEELSIKMKEYTGSKDYAEILGKAAANIACVWIDKAFDAGTRMGLDEFNPPKEKWMINEGVKTKST